MPLITRYALVDCMKFRPLKLAHRKYMRLPIPFVSIDGWNHAWRVKNMRGNQCFSSYIKACNQGHEHSCNLSTFQLYFPTFEYQCLEQSFFFGVGVGRHKEFQKFKLAPSNLGPIPIHHLIWYILYTLFIALCLVPLKTGASGSTQDFQVVHSFILIWAYDIPEW